MENLCWDDLRVLLAIYNAGSLLGAGKLLGLSTSTTARRLDALEEVAGFQLVHRSQSGAQLSARALPFIHLAQRLQNGLHALSRDSLKLAGTLRVSVPEGMAPLVARVLLNFRQTSPEIEIELIGENRMADVAEREADIAIRLVRSTSNVLIEKHIGNHHFSLYAAPEYLRKMLVRRRLDAEEAAIHSFVGLDRRWEALPHEQWMRALGATQFVFRSSSMEAISEAVHAGAGLATMLDTDPRTEGLEKVDTFLAGPVQPFYLVYHRDLRNQPHVRAAIQTITSAMGR